MNRNNKNNSNIYVKILSSEEINILKRILERRSAIFKKLNNGLWQAKLKDLSISAYKSGKVVIQGKEAKNFLLFTLEPEVLRIFDEKYLIEASSKIEFEPHIGIDESGKGDFFGPLVIAATFIDNRSSQILKREGVQDSKLIKTRKIFELAYIIKDTITEKNYSIVTIGPEAYNKLFAKLKNLNRILAWGHARALENLLNNSVECQWALSDKFGNRKLIENALLEKGQKIDLRQEEKAESDIAVAAASIMARAEFLKRIDSISKDIGFTLYRGAGPKVVENAAKIIFYRGENILYKIAKIHFRTYQKALDMAKKNIKNNEI